MRDNFDKLAERRIQEAIARGEFKNLRGEGKPVKINGLYFLPQKLRAAYTVLKNSGYLDKAIQENKRFPSPITEELNLPNVNPSISKQELSAKIFDHNVMMDCLRRR
ncbi:DnaJ family domain-containing protein [Desulfosporosinus sp. BG]|uniref:DnaJ family domain-containing protein n=1 Tax=Desulfosporosinus sp. BG TaxID=1633135 RepID=UPI00083A5065|nr:DnaJ family domain-containing protein [Desulfosporosinus sp. BG]ODA42939.1 hypothetical protein DSBG_0289 [Desulfosporosinus sp. BG]